MKDENLNTEETVNSDLGDVSGSLPTDENAMWIEANALFNKKEHSQDGRDLQMKHFVIARRQ